MKLNAYWSRIRNTAMKKKILAVMKLTFSWERQKINVKNKCVRW